MMMIMMVIMIIIIIMIMKVIMKIIVIMVMDPRQILEVLEVEAIVVQDLLPMLVARQNPLKTHVNKNKKREEEEKRNT